MILLLLIGFVAGVVTSLSPCVLPVLPVVLTAGAARSRPATVGKRSQETDETGGSPDSGEASGGWPAFEAGTTSEIIGVSRPETLTKVMGTRNAPSTTQASPGFRQPIAIASGLVLSFGFFTLFAGSILSLLGLPQDFLRDAALVLLGLVGIGMLIPKVGDLLERPFASLATRPRTATRSSFLLGLGLGLVFVPCAGPILAAISIAGSTHKIGLTTIALTAAYCLGAGIPIFAFATLGERASLRLRWLRQHARTVRAIAGGVLLASVVAIASNVTASLETALPGYTSAFQTDVEGSASIANQLHAASGAPGKARAVSAAPGLSNDGRAPNFVAITAWLNTPHARPVTIQSLRGKVVLVDFWTYSCINCRRSLPHVEALYSRYHAYGFDVIGVHTPEFSFEHVVSNVRAEVASLGVKYPVAIDNRAATWNAYGSEFWPSEFLVDAKGEIRYYDFGEGNYTLTETLIRELLRADGVRHLPPRTDVPDTTPTGPLTPESYLGYSRLNNALNSNLTGNTPTAYSFPANLPEGDLAFAGTWSIHADEATPTAGASLRFAYTAKDVYLVMSGSGKVTVSLNGTVTQTVMVEGVPNLYTLVSSPQTQQGSLLLTFSAGIKAYDFTFG
jgi:cytochrome c biogenesis protein CcdA/thiol-disulfide isomerase/thioredoxin